MAKIEGHLSSYTARHSLGTIAKKMDIEPANISDGYGHKDIPKTNIYLGSIADDEIDKSNRLINRFLL